MRFLGRSGRLSTLAALLLASAWPAGSALAQSPADLRPNGDGTTTGWTATPGPTFNTAVDDDPDAPTDADYVGAPNKTDGQLFVLLGDVPDGFTYASAVTIKVRHQESSSGVSGGSDTIDVFYQLYAADETTALTAETAAFRLTDNTWSTTAATAVAITGTNSRPNWNGARLRIRQDYTRLNGGDTTSLARVSAVEVAVTFPLTTYIGPNGGDFNTPGNWDAGLPSSTVPASVITAVTVVLSANIAVDGLALTQNATVDLNGNTLTVEDDLLSSAMNGAGTADVVGAGALRLAADNADANVEGGAANHWAVSGLEIVGGANTVDASGGRMSLAVSGTFTMTSGAFVLADDASFSVGTSFAWTAGSVSFGTSAANDAGVWSTPGLAIPPSLTLDWFGTAATSIAVNGDLTVNGNLDFNSNTLTVAVTGHWVHNTGGALVGSVSSTVRLDGAAKEIRGTIAGGAVFQDATIGGSISLNNSAMQARTLGAFSILGPGTFNASTGAVDVDGALTNSGTLNAGSATFTVGGDFTNDGTFDAGTSAFTLDTATSVTIGGTAGLHAFNVLTIGKSTSANVVDIESGDTVSVAGALTINLGTLRLNDTETLDLNGAPTSLTIANTTNAVLQAAAGTPVVRAAGHLTLTGGGAAAGRINLDAGTIEFDGSSVATLSPGASSNGNRDFFRFKVNKSGGGSVALTNGLNLNVDENLEIADGVLTLGANTVTIAGSIVVSAPGAEGTDAVGATVTLDGSGTQDVTSAGDAWPTFTMSGAGTMRLLDDFTATALTVSTGALDLNGRTLALTAGGTFLFTSSTASPNGALRATVAGSAVTRSGGSGTYALTIEEGQLDVTALAVSYTNVNGFNIAPAGNGVAVLAFDNAAFTNGSTRFMTINDGTGIAFTDATWSGCSFDASVGTNLLTPNGSGNAATPSTIVLQDAFGQRAGEAYDDDVGTNRITVNWTYLLAPTAILNAASQVGTGAAARVRIDYTLTDNQSDPCTWTASTSQIEYSSDSTDGANGTWLGATPHAGSTLAGAGASPGGTAHTNDLFWHVPSDRNPGSETLWIRIAPHDGTNQGPVSPGVSVVYANPASNGAGVLNTRGGTPRYFTLKRAVDDAVSGESLQGDANSVLEEHATSALGAKNLTIDGVVIRQSRSGTTALTASAGNASVFRRSMLAHVDGATGLAIAGDWGTLEHLSIHGRIAAGTVTTNRYNVASGTIAPAGTQNAASVGASAFVSPNVVDLHLASAVAGVVDQLAAHAPGYTDIDGQAWTLGTGGNGDLGADEFPGFAPNWAAPTTVGQRFGTVARLIPYTAGGVTFATTGAGASGVADCVLAVVDSSTGAILTSASFGAAKPMGQMNAYLVGADVHFWIVVDNDNNGVGDSIGSLVYSGGSFSPNTAYASGAGPGAVPGDRIQAGLRYFGAGVDRVLALDDGAQIRVFTVSDNSGSPALYRVNEAGGGADGAGGYRWSDTSFRYDYRGGVLYLPSLNALFAPASGDGSGNDVVRGTDGDTSFTSLQAATFAGAVTENPRNVRAQFDGSDSPVFAAPTDTRLHARLASTLAPFGTWGGGDGRSDDLGSPVNTVPGVVFGLAEVFAGTANGSLHKIGYLDGVRDGAFNPTLDGSVLDVSKVGSDFYAITTSGRIYKIASDGTIDASFTYRLPGQTIRWMSVTDAIYLGTAEGAIYKIPLP